jgi:hypothetical protein
MFTICSNINKESRLIRNRKAAFGIVTNRKKGIEKHPWAKNLNIKIDITQNRNGK